MPKQFNLTAKQRRVAEMIALGDPDDGFRPLTKVEVCEKTGCPRSTLYEWLSNNDDFVEYINHVADKGMESRVGEYYRQLDLLIFNNPNGKGPSVKALELALKALGKLKDNVKLDATVDEHKSISDMSNEELDELKRMLEQDNSVNE